MTYQSLVVIGASVLVAVFGYLFNPILVSRPLGPEGISELGVFLSLCVFLCFPQRPLDSFLIRYTATQNAKNKSENIKSGAAQCLKLSFGVNTLLLGAVVILAHPLQTLFHLRSTFPILGAVAFAYLAVVQTILRSLLQGLRWYGKYSLSLLIESFSRLLLGAFLLLVGFTVGNTMALHFIASALSTLLSYWFLRPLIQKSKHSGIADPISWKGIPTLFLYSLCIASALSIDVLMVKHYFPSAEAGLFIAASTLAKMTAVIIGPITTVAYSFFCDAEAKREKIKPLLWRGGLFILFFTLVLLAPVVIFPDLIIRITYGADFTKATPLLVPAFLAFIPTSFISLLCNYFLSKHRESFVYGLSLGCVLQFIFILCFHASLVTVFWASALGVISQLILCALTGLLDRHTPRPQQPLV